MLRMSGMKPKAMDPQNHDRQMRSIQEEANQGLWHSENRTTRLSGIDFDCQITWRITSWKRWTAQTVDQIQHFDKVGQINATSSNGMEHI